MATLHCLYRLHAQALPEGIAAALGEGDALLLLGVATRAAATTATALESLPAALPVYVLAEDAAAYGVTRCSPRVDPIDYDRFVSLAAAHAVQACWD